MTYKQTLPLDRAWTHAEIAGIPFAGLFAKLKSAVNIEIPLGYQDEMGFHSGVKPDGAEVEWPAKW
jgi:hypothetical protein